MILYYCTSVDEIYACYVAKEAVRGGTITIVDTHTLCGTFFIIRLDYFPLPNYSSTIAHLNYDYTQGEVHCPLSNEK